MRKLLLGAIALLSVNAYSQSYLVLNSGVTLTTDSQGFVYDMNNFVLPYNVKGNGGNFILEDKTLVTIDAQGLFYRNETKVKKIKGSGLNYFVSEGTFGSTKLFTIDDNGFAYELDAEGIKLRDIKIFGGNYFVEGGNLTIIRSDGTYKTVQVAGLDLDRIRGFAGNYFISEAGQFFTLTSEGIIKTFYKGFKQIKKAGGNYFIDDRGFVNTISAQGELITPVLPYGFNVKKLVSYGANYMIDSDGLIFTIDSEGQMLQRPINLDLTRTRLLSL